MKLGIVRGRVHPEVPSTCCEEETRHRPGREQRISWSNYSTFPRTYFQSPDPNTDLR